ncbi:MAG: metallophosphoesterase [Chloroflexi bacterium]|jgi:uncharacterized protein|nr:metallophosphoesterase [Chloroflexota bacterium]MBT3670825.1 metallophosphoesterase [Chloroflexota bacterium]MBT4002359.1 metallophosphoesterase [Chloroflexota bacterium]MBT4305284.1 metallophosphoesterase [Chloroflexota bacterium]MBT4532430.1 metallophosphoesterase [Chloroflexota bacterium]
MKILSVSDRVEEVIYSSNLKNNFSDIDLVLGCGDLPYFYLEYLVDSLNVPVLYVRGNHAQKHEHSENESKEGPRGAIDLDNKMINYKGILFMGFEGCLRYRKGLFQYSQFEMWWNVIKMIPRLWLNKIQHGRYLDILVTHSPAWEINDKSDLAHQGFKSFRWLIETFSPANHYHGHIHLYSSSEKRESVFNSTKVFNTYGFLRTEFILENPNKVEEK